MLFSRSDRTLSGKKLSVNVAYPRSYVLSRLVRGLTFKGALLGAALGFSHGIWTHANGQSRESNAQAMVSLAGETVTGAIIGAAGGLSGACAYALIGGPSGAVAGVLGASFVSLSTYSAIPSIAAAPHNLQQEAKQSLGYVDPSEAAVYTPVVSDATIKEEALPEAPAYNGPWNDRIVFLGMNPGPTSKATHLMSRHADVTIIAPTLGVPIKRVGNRTYNLSTANGIFNFVSTLGLNSEQSRGVRAAFTMCETGARDELAGLAQIWALGEKGAHIPSRLVLAGHSNGDGVWGDGNGSLRLGPLLQLSRSLPHATAQIEDAFVTGCYSGGEVTMDQYLLVFPRAKTIWAYEAQAPGVDNGATIDQAGWEQATRGRNATFVPTKSAVAKKTLAVWNSKTGYHGQKAGYTLDELRGKVMWMEENFFRPALNGENYTWDGEWKIPINITDPYTGPVRQYYSWLVRLTQRKDLPEDERPYWVAKKHQTIRLLYYGNTVRVNFQKNYGREVAIGYAKLGLNAPNFAHLPRAEALSAVHQYMAMLQKKPHPAPESEQVGTLLERGIQDLDPGVVPDGWV